MGQAPTPCCSTAAASRWTLPTARPARRSRSQTLAGRDIAFLPRHGAHGEFPSRGVPHRANLWSLRALGVRQILSVSPVRSVRADLPPGTLVLPDRLVDRLDHRGAPFGPGGQQGVSAHPYCPHGREAARSAALGIGSAILDGGILGVAEDPGVTTPNESPDPTRDGWLIVDPTAMPEAALARELALCYTTLALVTGGATAADPTQRQLDTHLTRLRMWLVAALAQLPTQRHNCECSTIYDLIPPTFLLP